MAEPHSRPSPFESDLEALRRDVAFVLDSPAFFASHAPDIARRIAHSINHRIENSENASWPQDIPRPECLDDGFCARWRARLEQQDLGNVPNKNDFATEVARHMSLALPGLGGRLGLLFEGIVVALLRKGAAPVVTEVAVREGHGKTERTLGAFDALVVQANEVEHWEMAVKFYLQTESSPHWHHCVGPGVRDRLDIKGTKTFLQQLPLSTTAQGHSALALVLAAHGFAPSHPLRLRAFTKGTVFYRWAPKLSVSPPEAWRASVLPEGLSAEHSKGWWVEPAHAAALASVFSNALVAPLPRLRWLGGVSKKEALQYGEPWDFFLAALPQRLQEIQGRGECLLASLHEPHSGLELSRGFFATPRFLSDSGR